MPKNKKKTVKPDPYVQVLRENRRLKKYLNNLCNAVRLYGGSMDLIMKGPSTVERGKNIAKLLNSLDFINDAAWHFGLGKKLPKSPDLKADNVISSKVGEL